MDIESFLTQFVEGYLFHDLENMSTLGPLPNCNDGAAGYPMVMSTLSGIELLGSLISSSTFSDKLGDSYFLDYWNNYLTKIDQSYEGFGNLFRKLIRHGLAHTYLAKHGVLVSKYFDQNRLGSAISYVSNRQEVVVDCVKFYKNLEKSYFDLIKPVVTQTDMTKSFTKISMQQRLDEMNTLYSSQSTKEFSEYMKLNMTYTTTSGPSASGASLSASGIAFNSQTATLPFSSENESDVK